MKKAPPTGRRNAIHGDPDYICEHAVERSATLQSCAGCILPSPIASANEVFFSSEVEIGFATRALAASADAEVRGLGAMTFEGQIIDKPYVVRARAVLAAKLTS